MKDYTIYTTTIQTQKLIMFAAIFQEELILFVPFEKEFCNKKLESFKKTLKASNIVEDDSKFKKLKIELDEYFKNQRDNFRIPIRLIGTPFQIKCWEALQKIEYGETISYKEEAKYIGNEKAYRAVANANGKNNLSIIVSDDGIYQYDLANIKTDTKIEPLSYIKSEKINENENLYPEKEDYYSWYKEYFK